MAVTGLMLLIVSAPVAAKKAVVVLSRSLLPYEQAFEGFKENFAGTVLKKDMAGDSDLGQQIFRKISSDQAAVVVTIGSEATMLAQKNLTDIPLVYTMVLDAPKNSDHISAGVLMRMEIEKQLKTVMQLFPDGKKGIGVIYNSHFSGAVINQARPIVKELGSVLAPIAVERNADIPRALKKLSKNNIDVLWSVVDPTVAKPETMQLIIKHALKEKIPFVALSRYHVKAGAFAALSVDYKDMGAQTAKIAKTMVARGKSMPAKYPRKLILYINRDTQKKIGLKQLPEMSGVKIVDE
jgi:putative tryptophan/tyrosine transport system substrate-binding protein